MLVVIVIVRMRVADLMEMLSFWLVRVSGRGLLLLGFVRLCGRGCGRFGEAAVFKHMHLRRRDAAAIDAFDAERRADVERGGSPFEDRAGNTRIDQSAEHHVSGDAGKAVQISDTHALPP